MGRVFDGDGKGRRGLNSFVGAIQVVFLSWAFSEMRERVGA